MLITGKCVIDNKYDIDNSSITQYCEHSAYLFNKLLLQ